MTKEYRFIRVRKEFKDMEKSTAAALGYPSIIMYQDAKLQAMKLGDLKLNVPRYEEFKFGIKRKRKNVFTI